MPAVVDYLHAFRYSTDMISCHDKDGIYLAVSPSCYPLLGYTCEELIGHSAYEFFHPDDLAQIQKSHATILSQDSGTRVSYRIRKKDNSYTQFETTCRYVPPRDDAEGVIYAYSRNISNRVEFEVLPNSQPRTVAENEQVVTICAWTNRVQHQGKWLTYESFLKTRFGLEVTHGISEEAIAAMKRERQKPDE